MTVEEQLRAAGFGPTLGPGAPGDVGRRWWRDTDRKLVQIEADGAFTTWDTVVLAFVPYELELDGPAQGTQGRLL